VLNEAVDTLFGTSELESEDSLVLSADVENTDVEDGSIKDEDIWMLLEIWYERVVCVIVDDDNEIGLEASRADWFWVISYLVLLIVEVSTLENGTEKFIDLDSKPRLEMPVSVTDDLLSEVTTKLYNDDMVAESEWAAVVIDCTVRLLESEGCNS